MASLFGEAEQLGKSVLAGGLKTMGHWWGGPAAAGVTALFSQWDHHQEKVRIKNEYENEIGATLGKKASDVKVHDMEAAAKKNPVIGEALKRSTTRRNLSIAATVVGTAAAAAIGAFFMPAILGAVGLGGLTGIGLTLAHGAVGALSFLGVETAVEKIGEKKLGLEEPAMKKVEHHPAQQAKLSASSQITYLKQLRARGGNISQQQVMTVIASANPKAASQITARFGASYDKLSAPAQKAALDQFGSQYHVAELTEALNNRQMRVQELAFAAYGQSSGTERFESPRERALKQKIDTLTAQLNGQGAGGRQGVAFARSGVSGTVLGDPDAAITAGSSRKQDTAWQRRINAQRQQQTGQALA